VRSDDNTFLCLAAFDRVINFGGDGSDKMLLLDFAPVSRFDGTARSFAKRRKNAPRRIGSLLARRGIFIDPRFDDSQIDKISLSMIAEEQRAPTIPDNDPCPLPQWEPQSAT